MLKALQVLSHTRDTVFSIHRQAFVFIAFSLQINTILFHRICHLVLALNAIPKAKLGAFYALDLVRQCFARASGRHLCDTYVIAKT
mmetsp:Transcript_7252/g.30098  ORF Transcript_7252/g.30098 Transcript_7252/m.30098 type:complete len:86 (+) Transcript_7252:872-1129(+)